MYIESQPQLRARPTTDGRWKNPNSNRRAPGRSTGRCGSNVSYEMKPALAGTTLSAQARRAHSAPMPSGPSSHFWPGIAYASTLRDSMSIGIAPADWAPSMIVAAPASRASAPSLAIGRTAPVVHRTWLATIARAGRSRAVRNASTVRSASSPSPMSTISTSMPSRSRSANSGPRPPGCSWRVVTTRSPSRHGSALTARFMPSVVEWVIATSSGSATITAAIDARSSAQRCWTSSNPSGLARPIASSRAASSSIASWVSAGIGPAVPALR